MFAFFIIFCFIRSKSKSVLKGEQLQLPAADVWGFIPLGEIFRGGGLNTQTNAGDEKKGSLLPPEPSSPLSFLPATSGVFSWPRCRSCSVLEQRTRRHMLSAGSAAVLAMPPGRSCRGRALAPPPPSICTELCALVDRRRGVGLDSAGLYDFPRHL